MRNDRRHDPRVDVGITAVVEPFGGPPIEYTIEDLSAGGALLRGDPLLVVGQVVRLRLYLGSGEPLVIDGVLVRKGATDGFGPTSAVAFRNLTAAQEDAIQDAILNALEALNAPASTVRQHKADRAGSRRSTNRLRKI